MKADVVVPRADYERLVLVSQVAARLVADDEFPRDAVAGLLALLADELASFGGGAGDSAPSLRLVSVR